MGHCARGGQVDMLDRLQSPSQGHTQATVHTQRERTFRFLGSLKQRYFSLWEEAERT